MKKFAYITIALGVIHLLATSPAIVDVAPGIAERGVLGGITTQMPPPVDAMPGMAALFSVMMGVLLISIGVLLTRLAPPRWLGVVFLVSGVVGGVLVPPTGFWLVAALGVWIIVAAKRTAS